jgi:ubiquinone/menaquinone biosynthesis C-methylase UbiE
MEASEDADTSFTAYAKKWDGMHTARSDREWHITWAMLAPTLEPYLKAVPRLGGPGIDCVDVGCGMSDFGLELCRAHRLRTLWLLDASLVSISQLQKRHAAVESTSIVARVADCRALPCPEHSVRILLDKGTLDAMESDADSHAMLVEMSRVLDPEEVIVSVSFPALKRLALLDATLPALGLMHHTFIRQS